MERREPEQELGKKKKEQELLTKDGNTRFPADHDAAESSGEPIMLSKLIRNRISSEAYGKNA